MAFGITGTPFLITNPVAGTADATRTTYSATAPFLLLSMASGSGGAMALSYIKINVASAVAAPVDVLIRLDTVNRYASGGSTLVAVRPNANNAATSKVSYIMLKPTAAAATAAKTIFQGRIPANNGADLFLSWDEGDSDRPCISEVGSLLIHVFDSAGSSAPSVHFDVGWTESK
jgi:hypothetical protein